jgi:hypothetical protein
MLRTLITRAVHPWTDAKHDRLFTPFAPNGAPPQLLARLYREYEAALPDEFVPPQHKVFRALVQRALGKEVSFARLDDAAPGARAGRFRAACARRAGACAPRAFQPLV